MNDILSRLAVALAIGLLVGLERGWRTRDEEDHQRAAGFRTFALAGLLGGLSGAASAGGGAVLIGMVFLGFSAAFTLFHWQEARADDTKSVTSVVAGMVTFLLGALAVVGDTRVAIAGGVATTLLLALREQLHRWVASLTWQEIRAVLTLLAMSFLLLPILPDRPIDPWNAINPHDIWLMAILIAGISFGGYVAVRALGDQLGVLMAGLAGGLASSTATTLTFARLGREHPASARLLSAGILVAGVVMLVRVGVVAVALNSALLVRLLPPLLAGGAVMAVGAGILLLRNAERETPRLDITNPLQIGMAIKLSAFIAIVLLASQILLISIGNLGVLIVAGLSGIADVDAVVISMARIGGGSLDIAVATQAILLATAVNTLVKAVLAAWVGGRTLGVMVGAVSLLALGFASLVALW